MVNTLRIRGRDSLGSWDPGHRLVAHPAMDRVAFGILFYLPPLARFCGGMSITT